MNLLYNFNNVTDEVITQKDLGKSPSGQNFIDRWTWPRADRDTSKPLRFKRTNTVEEYFYVRLIENDILLGIGALRILWDNDGDFIRESSMDIDRTTLNYVYRCNPHQINDAVGIIKSKLYQHLQVRLASGRYGRGPYVQPEVYHDCYQQCHEGHHSHCHEAFHRGYDDRGYDYRNHCRPYEPRPNPPVNGPYGGVYNAYQDTAHRHDGRKHD